MNPSSEQNDTGDIATVRDLAATWIVRRDRGFSAIELAEFEAWLAADRRHAEVFT